MRKERKFIIVPVHAGRRIECNSKEVLARSFMEAMEKRCDALNYMRVYHPQKGYWNIVIDTETGKECCFRIKSSKPLKDTAIPF